MAYIPEAHIHFDKAEYDTALVKLLEIGGGTYRFSANHRKILEKDSVCGCFYCMRIFSPSEIVEWCCEKEGGEEVTAICPHCGVDAIVGESTGFPIMQEFLSILHRYSFS